MNSALRLFPPETKPAVVRRVLRALLLLISVSFSLPSALAQLPPIITNQPVSRIVAAGTDVTFSVGVRSSTPVRYQWQQGTTRLAGGDQCHAYPDQRPGRCGR